MANEELIVTPNLTPMKLLRKALAEGFVLLDVEADNLRKVFTQALDHLVGRDQLSEEQHDEALDGLLKREVQGSTAIGNAAAIPHIYLEGLARPVIVFVRLARPLNLGAPDGVPSQFLFILVGPRGKATEHLELLVAIARLMSSEEFRYDASVAATHAELMQAFDRFVKRVIPPPVEERPSKIPEELQYTGRFAGGLLRDIRRRAKYYWTDIVDGLHSKCVSSTLFLFFACLAPAVTFGGFMALETGGEIGAVEMILASAVCGMIYAVFSGQPLIILGGTGPLLIFTAILYTLCQQLNIPFLPTYGWIGLWSAAFLIVLAVTDASCLMRFFTRFTDEIFAALISLIFITEAIKALLHIFVEVYQVEAVSHDKALLSLLLALGTYYIALNLANFRRSRYLRPRVREFFADFGPTIALFSMTAIAVVLHEVSLDPLQAPTAFGTTSGRAWSVNLFDAPRWVWFAAAAPALFVTILVYLDQNITARLINSPDHKLEKGGGYHLDLALVGLLIGGCSMFGLPWLVAATVRSLNHLRSLATTEEAIDASGQPREHVLHVRENRVTAFTIHLLIGVSLLLLPLLHYIPMAVLYGLFLYMGIVSMRGNQLFERLSLWLMDSALYPAAHYIRKVPMWVIHKFTIIQFVCLAILWVIKESILGILFPLFIALLVPFRFFLNRFFDEEHLEALDTEEEPEEEEFPWH